MKILIVEDQTMDILGTYELLWNLGHEVTLTFDGERGLYEFSKGKYDLLILDWNLPSLSGRNLLWALESSKAAQHRPRPVKVILHSGESFKIEDFDEYTHLQFLDIWKKPMLASEISKRLKSLVGTARRSA